MQESEGFSCEAFPVFRQAAATVEPSHGALDDPPLGEELEALGDVGAVDDFHFDGQTNTTQSTLENRPLIPTVGLYFEQEWIESKRRRHQEKVAIPVLDVCGMNDSVHQEALCVDQDMSLLSFDLFARIIAVGIDRDPPFSALFILCESMMAAVGLASRPACSRQATYKT